MNIPTPLANSTQEVMPGVGTDAGKVKPSKTSNSKDFANVLESAMKPESTSRPTSDKNLDKAPKNDSKNSVDKADKSTDDKPVKSEDKIDETSDNKAPKADSSGTPTAVSPEETAATQANNSPVNIGTSTDPAETIAALIGLPVTTPAAVTDEQAVAAAQLNVDTESASEVTATPPASTVSTVSSSSTQSSQPISQITTADNGAATDGTITDQIVVASKEEHDTDVAPQLALSTDITDTATSQTTQTSAQLLDTLANPDASKVSSTTLDAVSAKNALDMLGSVNNVDKSTVSTPTVATNIVPTPFDDGIPAEPFRQVFNLVAPLKNNGNGEYSMTMHLKPEALGHVEVAVTMNNGQISMQLSSDNPNSRQMLRDSMNDLRDSLESSGLQTGSLDVSDQAPQGRQDQQNGQQSRFGNENSLQNGGSAADTSERLVNFQVPVSSKNATDGGPLDIRV